MIPVKTLSNGFSLPVFGIGTWQMGGDGDRRRHDARGDEQDRAALRRALSRGITHIDGAELYAEGHAEELVGDVLPEYDRRSLFLVSKVWKNHLRYDDVIRACEGSLMRLGTDYLDLYLIHIPHPSFPMQETFRAMERLKSDGRIRHIGISNFTLERTQQARKLCNEPIVATQVHYNLLFREPERSGLLSFCQRNDMLLIAWRPVEKGIIPQHPPPLLRRLCEKYQKTPAQIALNWLVSQTHVVTLSTMRASDHLEENLGALGWTMEPDDIALLRRSYPGQRDRSDAVFLQ